MGIVALQTDEVTDAVLGLHRYALSPSRNHDMAEDLVHDTVVPAPENGDTFRGDSSAKTWLHPILHHRYIHVVRSNDAAVGWCPTCPPLFAGLVGVWDGLGRLRDPDTVITPYLARRLRVGSTGLLRNS